ncbi:MAG: NADH-quinone oxidoreductase subunit L [Candidatus Diapherotrites archaeon]|nr:NADH-quinone oxidoreductase subunit L [Candidatus Diapherotrites archaeon]
MFELLIYLPFAAVVFFPVLKRVAEQYIKVSAILFSLATAVVSLLAFNETAWIPGLLFRDHLSSFFTLIASVIAFFVIVYSSRYVKETPARFYMVIMTFVGSMNAMVMADSFFMFIMFWEIITICSYLLILYHYTDTHAVAAAKKCFIITHFGSIFLMTAFIVLLFFVPDQSIRNSLNMVSEIPVDALFFVVFMLSVAAFAKSAIFPFHIWLPDAMEAPAPASALLHSAVMVKAGVFLLMRFFPMISFFPQMCLAFGYLAAFSAIIVMCYAFFEKDIKRILAYSTIANVSIIFVSIFSLNPLSMSAALFHTLNHAFFKSLLFLGAGILIHKFVTRDITKMGGAARFLPLVSGAMIVALLAVAGVPPFSGSVSKWMILESLLNQNMSYVLLVFVSITLAFGVYLKMFNSVFLSNYPLKVKKFKVPFEITFPLVSLALATVALGVLSPFVLNNIVNPAVLDISSKMVPQVVGWSIITTIGRWDILFLDMLLLGSFIAGFLIYLFFTRNRSSKRVSSFTGGEQIPLGELDFDAGNFYFGAGCLQKSQLIDVNRIYEKIGYAGAKISLFFDRVEEHVLKHFVSVTVISSIAIVLAVIVFG